MPKIVFDTSYGKTAFGGEATYGSPQQMLIPVMITQIQDGKLVEVERSGAGRAQKTPGARQVTRTPDGNKSGETSWTFTCN